MKYYLSLTLGCLTLLLTSPLFAYSLANPGPATACCGSSQAAPSQTSSWCQEGMSCSCTDQGWRYNNCISKEKYCEAFGNVGGLT